MTDEWQEGETRQIDGVDVTLAAECTPDSECCGADLETAGDVLLCADCGGFCDYGERIPPDCRGTVTGVVDDLAKGDKYATVEVERDDGETVEAKALGNRMVIATCGLTAESLVGKPVVLEPIDYENDEWSVCYLDGIDYEAEVPS